jgi:hypothetical protein
VHFNSVVAQQSHCYLSIGVEQGEGVFCERQRVLADMREFVTVVKLDNDL